MPDSENKPIFAEGANDSVLQKFRSMATLPWPRLLALLKQYQETKDPYVKELLFNHNMRLVIKIVYDFDHSSSYIMDRISYGAQGLLHALDKYEPEKLNPKTQEPYRFSTYATWWIKQSISRGILESEPLIRIPAHINQRLRRIWSIKKDLENECKEDTPENILNHPLNTGNLRIKTAEDLDRYASYFYGFVYEGSALDGGEESSSSIWDIITESSDDITTDEHALSETHAALNKALDEELTPREAEVLRMRFGFGIDRSYTLEAVGKHIGLTRERIRQIEVKALAKIKKRFDKDNIDLEFLC